MKIKTEFASAAGQPNGTWLGSRALARRPRAQKVAPNQALQAADRRPAQEIGVDINTDEQTFA